MNKISCTLERTPGGWYLTFPSNPKAGLLLHTAEEKLDFAKDCGFNLDPSDLAVALQITECRQKWYHQACTFSPCPF